MKITRFNKFMDKYVRHAGLWHDEGCNFVYYDHGVCNCNTANNNRTIKNWILTINKKPINKTHNQEL
jgi:hypothetical protein